MMLAMRGLSRLFSVVVLGAIFAVSWAQTSGNANRSANTQISRREAESRTRQIREQIELANARANAARAETNQADAQARASQAKALERLSSSNEKSAVETWGLVAASIIGAVAIVYGASLTAKRSAESLLQSVTERGKLDRDFENSRNQMQRDLETKRIESSNILEDRRIQAQRDLEDARVASSESDERRRLKIALNDKQITILSDLIGEIRSYEAFALKILQASDVFDKEKETADKERFEYLRDIRIATVDPSFEARARTTRVAASYGSIPQSVGGQIINLSTYLHQWMNKIAGISASYNVEYEQRVDDIILLSNRMADYVLDLISYEEVQRSILLGSTRDPHPVPKSPTYLTTPYINKPTSKKS